MSVETRLPMVGGRVMDYADSLFGILSPIVEKLRTHGRPGLVFERAVGGEAIRVYRDDSPQLRAVTVGPFPFMLGDKAALSTYLIDGLNAAIAKLYVAEIAAELEAAEWAAFEPHLVKL